MAWDPRLTPPPPPPPPPARAATPTAAPVTAPAAPAAPAIPSAPAPAAAPAGFGQASTFETGRASLMNLSGMGRNLATPEALHTPTFRVQDLLSGRETLATLSVASGSGLGGGTGVGATGVGGTTMALQQTAVAETGTDPLAQVSGAGGTSAVQATPAASTPEAQASAAAQVEVNGDDVVAQRDQIKAEAQALADNLRAQGLSRADQIRARAETDTGNDQIYVDEESDPKVYREAVYDDDNELTSVTEVTVSDDDPPEVSTKESQRQPDGTWVTTETNADGTGDDVEAKTTTLHTVNCPITWDNLEVGVWYGDSGGMLDNSSMSFDVEGNNVTKEETRVTINEQGFPTDSGYARVEIRERDPDDVGLNDDLGDVFDPNGGPVLEMHAVVGETVDGEQQPLVETNSYVQGRRRVTRSEPDGQPATWLVEQQSADGTSKDSQLLIEGSPMTVATHTEVNGGSVTQTQKVYDSHWEDLDSSDEPELLSETTTTVNYGADGRPVSVDRTATDAKTGDSVHQVINRRVEGNTVIYDGTQQLTHDGQTTETQVTQTAALNADGTETWQSTTLTRGDEQLKIWEDESGRHFTQSGPNGTVSGDVGVQDGKVILTINGKPVTVNPDGKVEGEMDSLTDSELAVIPWLLDGEKGALALVESMGGNAAAVRDNIKGKVEDSASSREMLGTLAQGYSLFSNFDSTVSAFRQGNYVQGVMGAASTAVDAAGFTGSILDKWGPETTFGKALGVAGGVLQVAQGVYGEWTAETDAQFVAGASNIAAGGLSVALVFAVGTPLAPFLIAGILAFNGIGFVANYEQDHSTPPLADGNWDKQQE